MKSFLIIIAIFYSCSGSRIKGKNYYYYVEPFKEQEVKLSLNADSTFKFQDKFGCNQFEFVGKYFRNKDSVFDYMIFDSVKLQSTLPDFKTYIIFSISNGDTAWIINDERIFIHKLPFIATSNGNINLQDVRYRRLKAYYISLFGQQGFIDIFGNGKGRKEAKRRLLDCKLPDINIR